MSIDMSLPIFFLINKIISTIFFVCSIFGWFGNFLIIIATIRSKHLKNRCNILIAFQALSDFLHQLGHIPYVYFAFSETLISYRSCYFVQFVSFSACDFSTMVMFFIAVDRLIAAKGTTLYSSLNSTFYVLTVVIIALAYCTIFKVLAYERASDNMTMCLVPEAMTLPTAKLWFMSNGIINIGVCIIYGALTFIFKNTASENYKLNKSLNTMIMAHIFGWILTMIVTFAATLLVKSDHLFFVSVEAALGVAVNVNVALPFYIYYFRSSLYRREFRKIFGQRTSRVAYSQAFARPSFVNRRSSEVFSTTT
ncbi:hypothetical protein QR680_015290 [Steinernema hermaphroditum]|uniref:G-protein coupled receptors family 1 profile domain-containing protein n=1 Tax=Steinernema hermaphroditum TaxID=289476 RepID=A0AA39LJZ4_9BILA|nr:hypothetical protein QR680_015290 [Steinernema hermaphroditum]